MNPDGATRAAGNFVETDIAGLRAGEMRTVRWRAMPIFVTHRTPAMLAAMQDPARVSTMADAYSEKRQQPDYARNWHRSIEPAYAVLAGICTRCRCALRYVAEDPIPPGQTGGYSCPCCASRYDPAGRAYYVAQYNLAVPPYRFIERSRIAIGMNPNGAIFNFESIESG